MSGGGGSAVKQVLGAAGLALSIAAAPATGGASLLGVPGSLAALGSGMKSAAGTAKRAANAANNNMSALFRNKAPTPIAPTNTNSTAGIDTLRALQARSGRASTLLTSPGSQNTFGG